MRDSATKLLTYQKCLKYSPSTLLCDWNIDFPNMYHVWSADWYKVMWNLCKTWCVRAHQERIPRICFQYSSLNDLTCFHCRAGTKGASHAAEHWCPWRIHPPQDYAPRKRQNPYPAQGPVLVIFKGGCGLLMPPLGMRKQVLRGVKQPAHGHTTGNPRVSNTLDSVCFYYFIFF